jgi:hypothetical protein
VEEIGNREVGVIGEARTARVSLQPAGKSLLILYLIILSNQMIMLPRGDGSLKYE